MGSAFGRSVLARLLDSPRVTLCALVVPPSAPPGFPAVRIAGDGYVAAARRAGVAVIDHRDDDVVIDQLPDRSPDLVVSACYPVRISHRLAGLARLACLNLHPSRLPRYRGPDPLFWQLRAGEADTGVTVHRVEPRIDAGAILAERFLPLTVGASREALDATLAGAAVQLMLDRLEADPVVRLRPQDEAQASTQPMPTAGDRIVTTRWPVRRAYAFLRGASPAGTVFRIANGSDEVRVSEIIGMSGQRLEGIADNGDGTVRAGFPDGSIVARRA